MSLAFDAGWLALREGFDHQARSPRLAERLIATLPARPRLLDLGAGAGSLFRYLAPMIGRAQAWVFADSDPELLQEAFHRTAAWAQDLGCTVTWPARALLIHTPVGAWRVEGLLTNLAALPMGLPMREVDAVVCSALLDLVSRPWLEELAQSLTTPFLASLSVDGRDLWLPRHAGDRLVAAAFRRDQGRDKGFGPALGPHAPAAALRIFSEFGFTTASAASDWRIPATALRMARELVQGATDAALAAAPARRGAIEAWERDRLRQAMRGKLAIRVGHRDILALPA